MIISMNSSTEFMKQYSLKAVWLLYKALKAERFIVVSINSISVYTIVLFIVLVFTTPGFHRIYPK